MSPEVKLMHILVMLSYADKLDLSRPSFTKKEGSLHLCMVESKGINVYLHCRHNCKEKGLLQPWCRTCRIRGTAEWGVYWIGTEALHPLSMWPSFSWQLIAPPTTRVQQPKQYQNLGWTEPVLPVHTTATWGKYPTVLHFDLRCCVLCWYFTV